MMLSLCFLFWLVSGHRISQNHVLRRHRQSKHCHHLMTSWTHLFFQGEERSPPPVEDGAEDMDGEAGEVDVDVEPMTIDRFHDEDEDESQEEDTWLNTLILQTPLDMWNMFCLRERGLVFPVGEGEADHFGEDFGGQKVRADIPVNSVDELTGAALKDCFTFRSGAQTRTGYQETVAVEQPDHSMKMIPPQVRHRLFAKNVSAKNADVPCGHQVCPPWLSAVLRKFVIKCLENKKGKVD